MFTPSEAIDEIHDLGDEAPAQALFQGPGVEQQSHSSPVSKMARTDPDKALDSYSSPWASKTRLDGPRIGQPAKRMNVPRHLEAETEATPETTEAINSTPEASPSPALEEMPSRRQEKEVSPDAYTCIQSYDQLMQEIDSLGDIDSYTPPKGPSSGKMSRKAAINLENQGRMAPRVKTPVYIANLRGGMIEIADMEHSIADREVVDLSQVEAKKLRDSRDFKWCLDNGVLGFTDRGEFIHFLENRDSMLEENDRGLKAYSGPPGKAAERAADEMYEGFDDPLVDEVVSGSAHQRIKQAASGTQTSRRSTQAVIMDDNEDILDLDSADNYEDVDSVAMNNLMSSMDPGGLPAGRQQTLPNLPPVRSKSRSIPKGSRGGASGPKSIRKV